MRHIARRRQGLSLIETTFSILLVSVLMVSSLSTIAHVTSVSSSEKMRLKAAQLADLYLQEICSKPFVCPDCGSNSIGKSNSEGSIRSNWNDFDDYHYLYLNPLTDEDGNSIPDCTGWKLWVTVRFARTSDPSQTVWWSTDLKRVKLFLEDPTGTYHYFYALRSKYGMLQEPQNSDVFSGVEFQLQSGSESYQLRSAPLNQLETP
ncbi:MAG: hypothetical protein AAF483_22150 [Planctomycetota bacterium]